MNYNFDFQIPKNTPEADPYTEILKVTKGVVQHVVIIIPNGHVGLAHFQLFYHEAQLYPLNREASYSGNNSKIEFDEYQPLLVAPYELKALGWNSSVNFSHSFQINITILRPDELEKAIPVSSIEAMYDLIGVEQEVE